RSVHCASTATTRPRAIATASCESSLNSAGMNTVAVAAELTRLRTIVIKTARMFSPRFSESPRPRDGSRQVLQAYDARSPILDGFEPHVADRSKATPLPARRTPL